MRAFTSVDHIIRNHDFMKYLLSNQTNCLGRYGIHWPQPLGKVSCLRKIRRICTQFYQIMIRWCLGRSRPLSKYSQWSDVNSDGCPENELDNDNDGYTNDLDDCVDVAGNSTLGSIGCPDADGDGWGV